MKKNNQDIREKILKSHLKYWQIAEQLNINDGNFSRMLRKELPKEAKEKINNIIKDRKREICALDNLIKARFVTGSIIRYLIKKV